MAAGSALSIGSGFCANEKAHGQKSADRGYQYYQYSDNKILILGPQPAKW
jgi:hypothetical protein